MAKTPQRAGPRGRVRIIGGRWRGTRIPIPEGAAVRPTPDRVRETLFNWLEPAIAGARCLDLYAGSGVLGFEALSRGAESVCFVERDPGLAAELRAQGERLGAGGVAVIRADARRWLAGLAAEAQGPRFDIAFVDPPYEQPVAPVLAELAPALRAGARVYVERPAREGLPDVAGWQWRKRSRAGDVVYGLAEPSAGAD